MSKKFKALVIDNQNEKFTREIKELKIDDLKDGNVLIKIDFSGLNYKDALILNNGGRIVKKYPFVPGIDFSGIVEESEDDKFKKGDRIILTGFRVGEVNFGGFGKPVGGIRPAVARLPFHVISSVYTFIHVLPYPLQLVINRIMNHVIYFL